MFTHCEILIDGMAIVVIESYIIYLYISYLFEEIHLMDEYALDHFDAVDRLRFALRPLFSKLRRL